MLAISHRSSLVPSLASAIALSAFGRAHAQVALSLTADEVAQRAARSSHEVLAAEHTREAADASVDQAQSGYYPRLHASARYTRLSAIDNPALGNLVLAPDAAPGELADDERLVAAPLAFPQPLDQVAVSAQLSVPLSDYLLRVPHTVAAANASADAAALATRVTRLRVAARARVLYYDWVRSKLALGVAEQTLAQTRAHLADAERLAAVGSISQADVLSAQAQVAESELLLERAQNAAGLNEQRLRTAMHDDSGAYYAIGESVEADTGAAEPARDARRLFATALERRLELKLFEHNRKSLLAQGRAVRASAWPRLDGLAEATVANPHPRVVPAQDEFAGSWALGAQLSFTPTELPGALASARNADARAASLASERRALIDAIRLEIARSLRAEHEAAQAIVTNERRLRAAEESYRARTVLFQNGRATGVELADAEVELARARLDAIAARVGLRVARVELAHAVGLDTEP